MDEKYKFKITADIKRKNLTKERRKEVASVLELPDDANKQPDLAYFTSLYVSSNTNLNNAHFLASELVKANDSIVLKALDVEHEEQEIIGSIIKNTFIDDKGNELDYEELKDIEDDELNSKLIHVEIASVIYKTRFPEIAKEVLKNDGKWKVSMEAYYQDYAIKVGELIMSKHEAESLGFDIASESSYGEYAKVMKAGKVLAEGAVAKVLLGIHFTGVGIVENPANPESEILEVSSEKKFISEEEKEIIILDYDKIKTVEKGSNNVTLNTIEVKLDKEKEKSSDKQYPVTENTCVSYYKVLEDTVDTDQDTEVLKENWCSKYDSQCPTYGFYKNEDCLRFSVTACIKDSVECSYSDYVSSSKIDILTERLEKILNKVW